MADLDSNRFSFWNKIPDDSPFVNQAMSTLGFLCDFAQLSPEQQQLALALAQHFKRESTQCRSLRVVKKQDGPMF